MMCDRPFFFRRDDHRLTFKSADYPVYRIEEILLVYHRLVSACCGKSGLIADIGYVGTGKARCVFCQEFHIEISFQLEVLQVYLEDFHPFIQVGKVHMNLAVKTSGTQKRLVQNIRPVRRRKDDDTGVGVEAVHFRKQLVKGIFPFVIR